MPDFRIVQLVIDNEFHFVRRETVGSSTIDGENGYRSEFVISHFRHMLNSKTRPGSTTKPTRMDKIGANAKSINVTVLHLLANCDQAKADAIKADEIRKLKQKYPGKVINVR
jgi:hypothetical protein